MFSNLRCDFVGTCGGIIVMIAVMPHCQSQTLQWTRELGGRGGDNPSGVSADGMGNVYLSGWGSSRVGATYFGASDSFVAKYSATGILQWARQLGTSSSEQNTSVSADGQGNVYISGETYGSLAGASAGGKDAFIAKYDAAGSLQWTRQLGTNSDDGSESVSADRLGNVYLSGLTNGSLGDTTAGGLDAFIAKYNTDGILQWTRQLGTSSRDWSRGVAADGLGNVYLTGHTTGSLGGTNAGDADVFVTKYDSDGLVQWTRQLGTSASEDSFGVSADGLGNVYLSGRTKGSLGGANSGDWDAFLAKYDASGSLLWTRQFGTSYDDRGIGVAADGMGNIFFSGHTAGSLGGSSAGAYHAFVIKYDASGTPQWTPQLGTSSPSTGGYVSTDGMGHVYLAGQISGNSTGMDPGGYQLFISKLSEPVTGDYNGNGAVDGADFLLWQSTLGSTTELAADGDDSNVIDAGDLAVWKNHFGQNATSNALPSAIPEPGCALLLFVGVLLAPLFRRSSTSL